MMINRKYLAAALLFLAASCGKEETASRFLSDPDAVQITATVGAADTRSNPTGDKTAQTKFNVGDRVFILVPEEFGGAYTLGANGTWAPADPNNYLRWTSSTISLAAFYPGIGNLVETLAFALPTDQSTLEKIATADYMSCMVKDVPKTDGAINLNFERETALVVIDGITFKDQYATGYEVSAITVHGAYSSLNPPTETDVDVTPLHVGNTWSAILLPHAEAMPDHLFLTLTVHKTGSEDPDATLTVKGIPVLAKGTKNTMRLAVGKDVARVNSITVAPWTDKVLGDGTSDDAFQGTASELFGNSFQAVLNRGYNRWVITDSNVTTNDFIADLNSALEAAYTADNSRRIAVELPNASVTRRCSDQLALVSISAPIATGTDGTLSFKGCTALETVYLPNVVELNSDDFKGCTALETIYLPKAEKIGSESFGGCTALKTVNLPKVQELDFENFMGCTSLETVLFPEVTLVQVNVFSGCTSLKSISLPKATAVKYSAFANCSALTELTFGEVITTWEESDQNKIFASTTTENITLTLNAAQTGINGNVFQGYTFKEIKTVTTAE